MQLQRSKISFSSAFAPLLILTNTNYIKLQMLNTSSFCLIVGSCNFCLMFVKHCYESNWFCICLQGHSKDEVLLILGDMISVAWVCELQTRLPFFVEISCLWRSREDIRQHGASASKLGHWSHWGDLDEFAVCICYEVGEIVCESYDHVHTMY